MINYINELFNTREISTMIWTLIIAVLIYYIIKDKNNNGISGLFNQLIKLLKHLITIIILLYFLLMVSLSVSFEFYSISLLKNYFIWYFFVFFFVISVVSKDSFDIKLSEIFFSTLKFSIIPLFIISNYTFSIWEELVLFPIIFTISVILGISETYEKYKVINMFINIILAVLGLIILLNAFSIFSNNISDITKGDFWFSMLLDIILIFIHQSSP